MALDKNLKNLQILLSAMEEDHLTKEDFVKAFENVVNLIQKMQKRNDEETSAMWAMCQNLKNKMEEDTASARMQAMEYCASEMEKMMKDHEAMMASVEAKMASVENGKDADEEVIIETVLSRIEMPEYKETILDNPIQLRDKLESLDGEARLDKSAIKGLEDEIKNLKDMMSNMNSRRGGFGGPNANAVQVHSFTGDGTKSYTVPRHRKALMLIGTEAPILFKKTTDWTTANTTLTLNASLNDTVGQEFNFLYIK